MPTEQSERITILSSYYYDTEAETCEKNRLMLKRKLAASAETERQVREIQANTTAIPVAERIEGAAAVY
ncbi:Putative cytochrome b561 [Olea europaea subsp. europaea]|uniref:Cytochrome b561 n=1 Tax=Olea europaea subsp. europaea TaxID=158383 RepID=A0A8S0PRG0_OLEEU|nr:Putative cytochrome b561 [Olea europaea subsp. europaea]